MIDLLAKSDPNTTLLIAIGIFLLKFLLVSLALFLATHALRSIPILAQYLDRSWGRLVFYFVILSVAGFLTFWVVSLRILQSLALGFNEKPVVWADIILSGLALARLSMLWPSIVDWISRRRAA